MLSAARIVDTHLVDDRLTRFASEHARYAAAQDDVTACERRLQTARTRIRAARADLEDAIEDLACALVTDGASRLNPFASFGAPSPSQWARLSVEKMTKSVDRLVAAIRHARSTGERTSNAAAAVERAARALETTAPDVVLVEDEVRAARALRDAYGRTWHVAITALRHGARAAADDGAPRLYAMLFAPPRPKKRSGRSRA